MDFSAANGELWSPILSFGILAGIMLLSNLLLRKIAPLRRALIPTAVLAGFLLLLLRELGVVPIGAEFLDKLTYHAIALGFIAMSLRVPDPKSASARGELTGLKSGALIIGSYLIQGITGLAVSIILAYTCMPGLFPAAGILLPMGYGQGPGQANNVGATYERLGFAGGQSFGLSLAAAGYLCACTVGVIYLAVLRKKKKLVVKEHEAVSGSASVDVFQGENELPISQSIDRFSVQVALVLLIYLAAYLLTRGLTAGIAAVSPGLADSVSSILWGFNFIIGSVLAMLCRLIFKGLRRAKLMTRQYQNNYLLNRISGVAFDFMIICGIGAIDISVLRELWLPFALMAVLGCVVTFFYLRVVCRRIYPGYYYEGFFSMFGMMTGTISSGILLLREIDPEYETPAANNLVTGSSFAIALGVPMLIFVSLVPSSPLMLFVTLGLITVYFVLLMLLIFKARGRKSKA